MKQMRTGIFKTRCLKTTDDVQGTEEPVVITRRGVPVAKIVPALPGDGERFGFMSGEARIIGDIEAPIAPQKHRKLSGSDPRVRAQSCV